jgi:hypothetical protein
VNDREVRFGGCQFEEDKERYKGRAKDFYGFDEIGDFTESQYKFITTWNRSAKPGPALPRRVRRQPADPARRPVGAEVLGRVARPEAPEARQARRAALVHPRRDDEDVEVDGRGPHVVAWQPKPVLHAKSRTFIPPEARRQPGPRRDRLRAMLDSLPAELRAPTATATSRPSSRTTRGS